MEPLCPRNHRVLIVGILGIPGSLVVQALVVRCILYVSIGLNLQLLRFSYSENVHF